MLVSGRYRDPSVVLPNKVPLVAGYTRVISNPKPRRLHKGVLNQMFWQLNSLKTALLLLRCSISRCTWEKRWFKDVTGHWANQPIDWSARDLVYTGVVPFSRREYHGETSIGFEPSIDTRKQLGEKSVLRP